MSSEGSSIGFGEKRPSEDDGHDDNCIKKANIEDVPQESKTFFNGVEISQLTKRQMKKYLKSLKWEETKKIKRAKERIKQKEKRSHAKLNNINLGPSRKELKRSTMANSSCKISICIDLSFDDLMIDKVVLYRKYW